VARFNNLGIILNTNVKERIRVTKDGEIEITCPNCNLSKIFSIKKYIKHSKTVRVRIRCKCGFTKWAYPFPSKVAHQKIQSDKGFRDFHWGDEISSMPPDFEIISDESYGDPGCVTVGRLKNEKLAIGDIKITSIKYYFFNNQLGRIYIQGDWKYYDLIKVLLSQKYGEPKTLTYVENPMLRSILGKSMVRSNSIS